VGAEIPASFPSSSDEKYIEALSLPCTFVHNVVADGLEGLWLVKVNDAFCARFCSCAFRVLCTIPDDHTFSPILEVTQLKAEDLAWSESPMQHEENHRPVPFEPERGKELVRLVIIQRTRHALDGFRADGAPHGSLLGCSPYEPTFRSLRTGNVCFFWQRHRWRSLARMMGVSLQKDGNVSGVDRVIKRMIRSQDKNAG
jgi:hypothetical protein